MKILLCFLLLFLASNTARALNEGEKEVLESFRLSIPELAFASPPWTSDISKACNDPVFYGLECSSDRQHVVGVYVGSKSPFASCPLISLQSAILSPSRVYSILTLIFTEISRTRAL